MWALLLLLLLVGAMMLIVSGDIVVHVSATLGDTVPLPCNCSGRNLDKVLMWQKDDQHKVLKYKGNTTNIADGYKGRVKISVAQDSSDCSLQLSNITADDQGQYRCAFHVQESYSPRFIHLNVSANYDVCQEKLNGDGVFQCDVKGRYREAEILWFLEGELLRNSSTTIIHTDPVSDANGSYLFKSKLITHFKLTSEPKCDVKTGRISRLVSKICKGTPGSSRQDPPQYYMWLYTIIPVVLVLLLGLLVLWRCQKSSQPVEQEASHQAEARFTLLTVSEQSSSGD